MDKTERILGRFFKLASEAFEIEETIDQKRRKDFQNNLDKMLDRIDLICVKTIHVNDPLCLRMMDELIDEFSPEIPKMLLMSYKTRRNYVAFLMRPGVDIREIRAALDGISGFVSCSGIPIVTSEKIDDSIIYAFHPDLLLAAKIEGIKEMK